MILSCHTHLFTAYWKKENIVTVVISQVLSQAKCLGKVKLVPLALALVQVSRWVEAEAGSLDHPALEENASLVPLGLEGRHHTSLVSLLTGVYSTMVGTKPYHSAH